MQRTLVLLKPDAVQRGLVGELISRIERRGLKLAGVKLAHIDVDVASRLYAAHVGEPFFTGLIDFITSAPLVAMVVEGEKAVGVVRLIMGGTDPIDAAPGTVRGDLAIAIGRNLIHGSDSPESAQHEIEIFFSPGEIFSYPKDIDRWIVES